MLRLARIEPSQPRGLPDLAAPKASISNLAASACPRAVQPFSRCSPSPSRSRGSPPAAADEDSQQAIRRAHRRLERFRSSPEANGKTLEELVSRRAPQSDLVILPAVSQVLQTPATDRFGFGVFTVGGDNVPDAQIALYAAKPNGKAAIGPYPASSASRSRPSPRLPLRDHLIQDPDAAHRTSTQARSNSPPRASWRVLAMVRDAEGNYSVAAVHPQPGAEVGQFEQDVPHARRQGAKLIHTPDSR